MIICLNYSNDYTPFVQRVSLLLKNAFFLLYKGYLFSKKRFVPFLQRAIFQLKNVFFSYFKGSLYR